MVSRKRLLGWSLAGALLALAWRAGPASAGWKQVPGGLAMVSVGKAGVVWGVQPSQATYRWTGKGWQRIPGGNSHISVGADGTVWGVNRALAIYRWRGKGWQRIPGGLSQVSVGSARHIWGVNRGLEIWRWTGRGWQKMPGRLSYVSVGADGTVWGVNRGREVYRWTGNGWKRMPGALTQVSVGSAKHIWGVSADHKVWRWTGKTWQVQPGQLRYISIAADGTRWGVAPNSTIWRWPAGPVAPKAPPPVAQREVPPTDLVVGLRNLARGKPAQQSATAYGGVASRAVDGNRDGRWQSGSVSHTAAKSQSWWQVDLGASYQIAEIRLWNRTDCCGERLADFRVLVSQQPLGGKQKVWSEQHRGRAGRLARFRVNQPGRYVRVQLGGKNFLQLAEVEVLGSNPAEAKKMEARSRAEAAKAHQEAASAASELALLFQWDPSGKPPAAAKPVAAAPKK